MYKEQRFTSEKNSFEIRDLHLSKTLSTDHKRKLLWGGGIQNFTNWSWKAIENFISFVDITICNV